MGRKHGSRNKAHYNVYRANSQREKNKLKRIMQSNGAKAAAAYATKHTLSGWFKNNME